MPLFWISSLLGILNFLSFLEFSEWYHPLTSIPSYTSFIFYKWVKCLCEKLEISCKETINQDTVMNKIPFFNMKFKFQFFYFYKTLHNVYLYYVFALLPALAGSSHCSHSTPHKYLLTAQYIWHMPRGMWSFLYACKEERNKHNSTR